MGEPKYGCVKMQPLLQNPDGQWNISLNVSCCSNEC